MPKLTYRITGRTTVQSGPHSIDRVSVEWTHADGPVTDTELVPTTHPPDVEYEERPAGTRAVIHDQIDVPHGTPDSVVMMQCEEKRARLAANLGVEA